MQEQQVSLNQKIHRMNPWALDLCFADKAALKALSKFKNEKLTFNYAIQVVIY